MILLGLLVSFYPINVCFLILPFFAFFRGCFARCENVSRVVRHFYFIELAFLSRLRRFEFLLKNGVRTFRADMFFEFVAFCETKKSLGFVRDPRILAVGVICLGCCFSSFSFAVSARTHRLLARRACLYRNCWVNPCLQCLFPCVLMWRNA